ncbi:MAG TPA: MarR family winged helix-turn-helix transcriptional regulator [Azospira sp.]|jgi:DNA-binding MarR family transcriptional regulator|nr:MarR family winged helix-turn-helix transcriptional regulator [Azospira sp.]
MAARSDDPRLLSGLLSHRVLVLSNTLALAASRYYPRQFGVRLSEWRVIDALHAGGEISANQISQWLMTDKAWVSRSVERLIEEGYVRRAADPGHGRRLLIRLTAKGERAYAAIAAAARQRNENLLECLTAAQQQTLRIALERLEARAAAMLATPHLGFETMDEG